MKNVYISVPMRGRKKEDIEYSLRKLKRIARAYFANSKEEEEQLNFLNTIVRETPPEGVDEKVWYLGAAIQNMSKADYFIGVLESYDYSGCETEKNVFLRYHKSYGCFVEVPMRHILTEAEIAEDNQPVKCNEE